MLVFDVDVVGKGSKGFWTQLFWGLDGKVADGAVVVEEENPDDAAIENKGTGATMPLPCISHPQLDNCCEETASTVFSVAIPCK